MSFLLQEECGKSEVVTQWPFHLVGTGPRSSSLKLLWLGVMPVSMTAMTRSEPKSDSLRRPELPEVLRPRN